MQTRLRPFAPLFLRFGLGFVFLLFAYHKLAVPEQGRVEIQGILDFVGLGASAAMNYYLGLAEALIALSFFLGWKIRWSALLAAGLIGGFFGSIMIKFGLTNDPNLYRDVGIFGAAVALWLIGAGPFSLDSRLTSEAPLKIERASPVGGRLAPNGAARKKAEEEASPAPQSQAGSQ